MKTPRFWYPKQTDTLPSLMSDMLLPVSCVFRAGTALRRAFAKPYAARVPILCIGNVVAGGAGKTPTSLALARILTDRGQKPVFVTRGYGGHGQLTYVDPAHHEAREVGDEALLLAASSPTWAGDDRVASIRQAESHGTIIIMDDGLQNPHIKPSASILVVDGDVGIGNGRIIPAGPLRESLSDVLKRVVAVIIIGDEDRQNLAAHVNVPVFRARLQPIVPADFPRESRFVAFAGIARPEKFYATARALGLDIADSRDFPDHHPFSQEDIDGLRLRAETLGARLLTTEKDAARLPPDIRAEIVVLPVSLVFDDPRAETEISRLCISSCAL
ncbi:MAG: tetraacyldisaccharide 4'-kinase [Alphaproteobacteria bacterium]